MPTKLQIQKSFENITNMEELESVFDSYLGKFGSISLEFKNFKDLGQEEKKSKWAILSELKNLITELYDQKKSDLLNSQINSFLKNDLVDISIDVKLQAWFHNLLVQTRKQTEEICSKMWFIIAYWHEIVSKYENFEAVNIPLTHPATDMHDTIYLDETDTRWENMVFRTHTSSMQNAIMKTYWVPLMAVIPGRVYRYENVDASHDTMFYQLEGILIDENIWITHFKKIITDLLSEIFGIPVEIRMRPWYFPFVEPWFEIDATCPICKWNGCSLCKKTGRIEIMWAGMIHPEVLRQWWVDSSKYSGFAFGIGINRVVAIKYGIKDIRYFTNGDLRFLRSF